MAARFLNADLEILSPQPLYTLRNEIGAWATALHCGTGRDSAYLAVFEIDGNPDEKEPETLILRFCNLIESLDEEALMVWRNATRRIIDLGYEVDTGNNRSAMNLSPETLARMAALDITLAFTIYPPDSA